MVITYFHQGSTQQPEGDFQNAGVNGDFLAQSSPESPPHSEEKYGPCSFIGLKTVRDGALSPQGCASGSGLNKLPVLRSFKEPETEL